MSLTGSQIEEILDAGRKVLKYAKDNSPDKDESFNPIDLDNAVRELKKAHEKWNEVGDFKNINRVAAVIGLCKVVEKGARFCGLTSIADNLNKVVDPVAKAFKPVEWTMAIRAFQANPAAACAAAFSGHEIAKAAVDGIRWVDPNLDTDQKTKDAENKVFGLVGGGAGVGASVGGVIGGIAGAIGGPLGVAGGAAVGAALGGGVGSAIGAVLTAI